MNWKFQSGERRCWEHGAVLKDHLESGTKKYLYISHEIQIELIQTCADVLQRKIIEEVKRSSVFLVLADETTDISGTEQLLIGVPYLLYDDVNKKNIILKNFSATHLLKN